MAHDTDCRQCGHPVEHHESGECWTDANGEETWGETSCPCDWYDPIHLVAEGDQ